MRKLPPFAAIRAFEAAARHGSFKRAAAELHLSPTAISHQVSQLEQLTGRALFVRKIRRVEPTEAARELLRALSPALDAMADAFAALAAADRRRAVTIGAGAIFASRWLAPRLATLWRRHPDVDLRVHHSPLPVHTRLADVDLAVAWGDGRWPGMTVTPLLRIDVTPVLAQACLTGGRTPTTPTQLLSLPLLHHRDHEGWQQWLAAAGTRPRGALTGVVFEDANVLLQAVLAGQGVGLGILPFIGEELASGRLLRPFELAVDPGAAYYLVHRPGALDKPAVRAVHEWLLGG